MSCFKIHCVSFPKYFIFYIVILYFISYIYILCVFYILYCFQDKIIINNSRDIKYYLRLLLIPVTMWFLNTPSGGCTLTRRLCSELLPGRFSTRRFTSRLLRTCHNWKYLLGLGSRSINLCDYTRYARGEGEGEWTIRQHAKGHRWGIFFPFFQL